jgi:hypothetical protein
VNYPDIPEGFYRTSGQAVYLGQYMFRPVHGSVVYVPELSVGYSIPVLVRTGLGVERGFIYREREYDRLAPVAAERMDEEEEADFMIALLSR